MTGKSLERDLGLAAVLAISIGAMIGSGIFILPALALKMAGPAVVLAYLLAGLLVVPAALSKSEMATAMPEAGGTYIFIERGMGPLLGTIAGVGTWFSLSFKSALALIGGIPYLLLLFDLPSTPVALALGVALIAVNLFGVKQTGRLQVAIVAVMLAALAWFVVGGVGSVDGANFEPFLIGGPGGLFAATGLVFVSYAGVTKVASVAEEVEDPGRNIPIAILGSLAFTTLLYVGIVAVIVGVVDPSRVAGSLTPVAVAAEAALGPVGVAAVVLSAILALVSTANAGLLSSARYPFAMSRDRLAPLSLSAVHDRFGTPTRAITLTGGVMLLLIAFVPILQVAKLASAFQILVFVLINAAVVAFREGSTEGYDPEFESPLYPWMQAVGAVGGLALLTRMGTVPLVGAALIVAGGAAWYLIYARSRVRREGAATDVIRRQLGREVIDRTADAVADAGTGVAGLESETGADSDSDSESGSGAGAGGDAPTVLVALTRDRSPHREASLVRLAADLVRERDGRVSVVRFEEVPDQAPLDGTATVQSPADLAFEERIADLADSLEVSVETGEVVSHDTKHAVVNYADDAGADRIVAEHDRLRLRSRLVGDPVDWIVRHAPCDVLLVENRGYERPERIVLAADGGPYPPSAVAVADAVATATGGEITFAPASDDDQTDRGERTVAAYREEVADICRAPVRSDVWSDGGFPREPDLLVQRGADHRLRAALFDRERRRPPTCTEVTVYPHESRRPGVIRRLLERTVF